MKKMKLMSLLTALLIVLGYNNGSAQTSTGGTQPIAKNTVTRNACIPGYPECSNATVILKLSTTTSSGFNLYASHQYNASGTASYPASYGRITVTLKSPDGNEYTNNQIHYLPTVIGESTYINLGADGEGNGPYTIGIYKNANRQYILSVGNMAQ
ncbi:hypothetical protein F0919_12040 [Taibaiella lutea]|uniref:Uncharacterized protein n=1 Tax=Taibaiella lutea TaxID=2608001 RepID=A0A5M6CDU5_9BACT|nr:hypothetical protein [Taibaiella lutea]KAA5533271.1 hypothetical protein F0919_12040 [Taibaiella lutea]